MREIKFFKTTFLGAPTDIELEQAIAIANENDCIVRLEYLRNGINNPFALPRIDVEPGMTLEQCHASMHKW